MTNFAALDELIWLYQEAKARYAALKKYDDSDHDRETRETLALMNAILRAIIDEAGGRHSKTLESRRQELFDVSDKKS